MDTINVNILFEKNTFENIELIKNNLYGDADKNKDELKQIIGQSYRDLMSISNVIGKMMINCDNLNQDLNRFKQFCDKSKFNPKNNINEISSQSNKDSIDKINELNRIKLKIIINSPNLILDALNDNNILKASILFRRAKFLSDEFKNDKSSNVLINHISFLIKLSNLIYQKYLDITNYENFNLDDDQLFKILFAICLLKDESFDEVILEFLSNRKLQSINLFKLNNNQLDSEDDNQFKLLNFYKIIFNSLEIIFNLFNSIDDLNMPFIVDHLKTIKIDYMFLNRDELLKTDQLFLELNLEKFIKLNNHNLRKQIELGTLKWLEDIRTKSVDYIQNYLQSLTIDKLYILFDQINQYFDENKESILKCHYYEVICKQKIDFWDYFLAEPFNLAWKYYLNNTIIRLFNNLKNKIQFLNEEEDQVINLSEYIWSNDLNDLNEMHKRYCGTTERIIELINQTNEEFNYLLDNFLFKQNKELNKLKSNFYLIFKEQNDEFLNYINNQINNECVNREQNFNLAHLIRMLVLMCPNYKQCFSNLNLQNWLQTREHLLNLSYQGYYSYIKQIIDDFVQLFIEEYNRNQSLNCLHITNCWLEIEIKELIDDGKEVSTKIYIPKQISLPLDNLLINLITKLNKLNGHTLPNKLRSMILDELVINLIAGYNQIYDNMHNKLTTIKKLLKDLQNLQIYFDLMFLKNLLFNILNDDNLKQELNKILNQFQQLIDPFDLHLFSPYIQKNLEENKSNLSMLLNYLLPPNQQLKLIDNDNRLKEERKLKLKFNLL